MSDENSFNAKNLDFGNIIILFNNYSFYIKLLYQKSEDSSDQEIYYFVFSLKDNNIINSFGLFNQIIENINVDKNISKSYSEFDVHDNVIDNDVSIKGTAYKNNNALSFLSQNGIEATLYVFISSNGPSYQLKLKDSKLDDTEKKEDEPRFLNEETQGDNGETQDYNGETQTEFDDNTDAINSKFDDLKRESSDENIQDIKTILIKQILYFKNLKQEVTSLNNKIKIELVEKNRKSTGKSEYSGPIRNFYPGKLREYFDNLLKITSYQYDVNSSSFNYINSIDNIDNEPSFNIQLQEFLKGIITKFYQRNLSTFIDYQNKIQKIQEIIEINKFSLKLSGSFNGLKKEVDVIIEKINNSLKSFKSSAESSIVPDLSSARPKKDRIMELITQNTSNFYTKILDDLKKRVSERKYLLPLVKYLEGMKIKMLRQAKFETLDEINIIRHNFCVFLAMRDIYLLSKEDYAVVKEFENSFKDYSEIFANKSEREIIKYITKNLDYDTNDSNFKSSGGACDKNYEIDLAGNPVQNAVPVISTLDKIVTDLSKLQEPIIYIENSITVEKLLLRKKTEINEKEKMPVFGYLTIGKELIIKLSELQGNQNHSFQLGKNTTTKLIDWMYKNPFTVAALTTVMLNTLTKFLVDNGYTGEVVHVKNILTSILSYIVGPSAAGWATFLLSNANAPPPPVDETKPVSVETGGKRIKSKRNKFKIFKTKNKKQKNNKTKKKQKNNKTKNKK